MADDVVQGSEKCKRERAFWLTRALTRLVSRSGRVTCLSARQSRDTTRFSSRGNAPERDVTYDLDIPGKS